MSKSKAKNNAHSHKYKRVIFPSGYTLFRCVLDGCTHSLSASLLPGRQCICWRCGETFVILEKHTELSKPHCESCTKPNKNKKVDKSSLDELRTMIMGE